MNARFVSVLVVTGVTAIAAACSGGDGGSGPAPSIQVSASPASLSLQQGLSGDVSVTLVRGGGFSGTVTVSVEGLPSGVTTSVTPTTLTGSTTSATVTVSVAAAVVPGTYAATIRARATGVGEATASYQLIVTAIPNYALSASPAVVSVPQATTGTATINLARTNFTGGVALSLDAPPAGITGAFAPATAPDLTSQLTISVAATVALGNYTLTVKGSATGPGDRTTTIALTVTQKPDFSLSVNPSTLTINAGASQPATITLTRTNYTGLVTLSLESPPAGVTAVFDPAAPTGTTSAMTLSVAASVAPGNYNLQIKGNAPSVPALVAVVEESPAALVADRFTTLTLTVMPAPDFAIATTPAQVTTTPGGSANVNGTLTRTNLTGSIALDLVTPVPGGITGVFTPATTTASTFVVALSVPAATQPGSYTVTVRGTTTAPALVKMTQVQVTVVAGPAVALALNPTTLTIQAGSSGGTTATATRTNYTGSVTLAASGPNGVGVGFAPMVITGPAGSTSVLTVTVGGSVTPGTYSVTITGTTSGAGTPTAGLQLTVTAPPAGQVVWTFGDPTMLPTWFGFQDGTGPWTQVQPVTAGGLTTFTFNIASATGAVAFTMSSGVAALREAEGRLLRATGSSTHLPAQGRTDLATRLIGRSPASAFNDVAVIEFEYRGTEPELRQFGTAYAAPPGTWGTVGGVNVGLPANDMGFVAFGGYSRTLTSADNGWGLTGLVGSYSGFRLRSPLGVGIDPFFGRWYRDQPFTINGASLDMNAWTSDPPVSRSTVSIVGGPIGALFSLSQGANTTLGNVGPALLQQPSSSSPTRTAFQLQGTLTTDNYYFNASGIHTSPTLTEIRSRTEYRGSTVGGGTIALPAGVNTFTVTQSIGGPGENLFGTTFDPLASDETSVAFNVVGDAGTAGGGNSYTILATRAWILARGTTLVMQSKAGAGFPSSAYLALPRVSSAVTRTGTNITGPLAAGSYSTNSTRVQIP